MAPNVRASSSATPDFRTSPYFRDERQGSDRFLELEDEDLRPVIPFGATPLGNSIKSFRIWYAGCARGSCPRSVGWSDIAAANDPNWGCRRKYLLVVSDGDETCTGPDACSGTAALFAQEGVKTFVVAFGVENTAGNRLNCMAASGGSGDPIYPQNKQDLVNALTDIFAQIREESRTFASAAVPSVQAEVSDKIYLSNFTPLNGESFWDGHVDAFLKPLPLTDDNRPDRSRSCSSTVESSCHLWDAGVEMVAQAPTPTEVAAGNLKLGLTANTRRVFYSQQRLDDRVPSSMRLFQPATDPLDQLDLWLGLEVAPSDPLDPLQVAQAFAARQN